VGYLDDALFLWLALRSLLKSDQATSGTPSGG